MEKPFTLISDGLNLEGRIEKQSGTSAVIITHPHPLMGGDMDNPVVNRIRLAYLKKGYSTVRFNFRGTGQSEGDHNHGCGEINDVKAAFSYLRDNGFEHIDLSGYSFGAWVNLMTAANEDKLSRLVLVSPPVDYIKFEPFSGISNLFLVISGSQDAYASPDHIKKLLKNWNKNAIFKEILGADHFYSGALDKLGQILEDHL